MHKFNRLENDPFFINKPANKVIALRFQIPGRTDFSTFYRNISIPNFCPFENESSYFRFVINTPYITRVNGMAHFGLVFQCPSCFRYCIIDYTEVGTKNSQVQPYKYNFIHPSISFSTNQFKMLSSISPNFKNIYIQAAKAEKLQLDEIYPMGYRKALEFLIDGYLMKIRGKSKHTVIQNRLSENIKATKDPDLINTAQVTAWAGNDKTHLKTRNPSLNTIILKDSLNAFAHFVIDKLISKSDAEYIKDTNK